MTSHDTTTNPTDTNVAKKALIALGVAAVAVAAALSVVAFSGGSDDSVDDASAEATATADQAAPEAPVTDPAGTQPEPEAPAVTEPEVPTTGTGVADEVAEDAEQEPESESPVDSVESPATEARPVPTIVIGQDENGEDIVVVLEISEVCATTFHTPLDADSLSFIRWEYDAPGLAVDTPISFEGSDGFSHFTKVTVDQKIIVEQGISSYGNYDFPTAGWTDGDVETSIDPDGSHTVDDREGEASLTCLS